MAAESVGLAASVAGLLSLGLQITGGVVKYLDAFKGREEELAYVKQQNNALTTTLLAIEAASSNIQGQPPTSTSALSQNIQSCKNELNAVEALRVDLADCDRSSLMVQLENKKKKLTFPFHRSKIQQLAQRLQQANGVLQLTLTGLGLKISSSNTNKLTAIESSSQTHSSELLLIRSEVEKFGTPIASIHDRLPDLQGSLDTTAHLAGVTTRQVQENYQAIQQGFQQSYELVQLQSRQQQEEFGKIKDLLEKLQLQSQWGQPKSKNTLATRVAGKPAVLKELCDGILGPKQGNGQHFWLHQTTYRSQSGIVSQFTPTIDKICICPQTHRLTAKRGLHLSHIYLSSEWESKGHWPSCPLSNVARENRRAVNLKYTGLTRMLQSVINTSFVWTCGAGGFSISPNFTYYPIVDVNMDPAFRIICLIRNAFCALGNKDLFMVVCLRKLIRLFDDKKAYPAAISDHDMSLMHYATSAISYTMLLTSEGSRCMDVFLELIRILLSYGAPAFTYDAQGNSPLYRVGTVYDIDGTQDVVNALIQANSKSQPAVLDTNDSRHISHQKAISTILRCNISHGYAEAFECSPLSMAVIRNDANEVAHILSRFPSSLVEFNINGQSPLHLAAAKPLILALLVEVADRSLLNQVDKAGVTALEAAMVLSGRQCVNKSDHIRCRQCTCTQCVEILLGADCDVQMQRDKPPGTLNYILNSASELARRRYAFYMKELRAPRPRRFQRPLIKIIGGRIGTTLDKELDRAENAENNEDWNWIYGELNNPQFAELFYRHGFRLHSSFFIQKTCWHTIRLNSSYICWLVEHGADLFLRSSTGPPLIENSPNTGLFGAHYAFYLSRRVKEGQRSVAFNKLSVAVERRNITDGCQCNCSTRGCSPFIWMMKGLSQSSNLHIWARYMFDYYSKCDIELTALTYAAAIRYVTFLVLGLTHTCCDAEALVEEDEKWIQIDDVDIINEEQASLLEVHDQLVAEFKEKAPKFFKIGSDDRQLFSDFWSTCWLRRMEEVLAKLDGDKLTDAERRAAEDAGVRWCEPAPIEREQGNPYEAWSLEHWFYELDLICPEYNEPWPEDLRQVTELP